MALALDHHRSSRIAGAIFVAAAVAAAAPGWWLLVPGGLLLVAAGWLHASDAPESAVWLAAILCGGVSLLLPAVFGVVWPIPQLLGLAAAGVVLRRHGWRPDWLGPGQADRLALLLAVVSIPLTTIALVAFIGSGRTDLETATEGLQSLPTWTLPLVGIGFVLANPTVEEIMFRGVLQSAVADATGRAGPAIAVQAVAFGAIHAGGVPGGPLGMAMAASWGGVLGVVKHRTGSIRLVWIVHVFANIAIYSTVVTLARRDNVL